MNKSGIVEKVHELTGIKKGECETVIDAFILAIKEALIMGERISLKIYKPPKKLDKILTDENIH